MKTLNTHLKSGQFEKVYLLYGDEAYLRTQYKNRLISALIPEGDTMNISIYEGKNIDENSICDIAITMPFFSDHRVIVIEDSGFFKSSGHDAIINLMPDIPETTCMIFVESEADKRNRLYKAVAKHGYVSELKTPSDKQLKLWLMGIIKKEGKQIRESTLDHFMETVDHNMVCMSSEMEKLISYVGEREVIETEDVDIICSVFTENRIFDMIRALAAKDKHTALKLYEDLVTLKEPPMRILYLINKQFESLLQVKELVISGYPVNVIADLTKSRDFIVKRSISLCGHFTFDELKERFEYGLELDASVKSGRISDKAAVELMLCR